MEHHHTLVWLDRQDARIFHLGGEHGGDVVAERLHAPRSTSSPPTALNTAQHLRPAETRHFHAAVTEAIATGAPVLIVGPAKAKLELIRYLHRRAPLTEAKVVGVETLGAASDQELIAYARDYFVALDQAG